MTLIEAIRSGKSFKRMASKIYKGPWQAYKSENVFVEMSYADILADDWEIQEESITVTRSQVEDAFDRFGGWTKTWEGRPMALAEFCKALGFKE